MFPALEVLSQQEIQDIHTASVEILDSVGIEFRHAEVLELLRKEGARVEGTRVCFPRELINQALKTAPEGFRLEEYQRVQLGLLHQPLRQNSVEIAHGPSGL